MKFVVLLWLAFLLNRHFSAGQVRPASVTAADPRLLIVSYGGFRPDYLQRNLSPSMSQFRQSGVYAPYMRGVFPTKPAPCLHSIATGFYPGVHGVLGDTVFDSKLGSLSTNFNLYHLDESILPIWTLNELAGKRSGCMMWPGSNYRYAGRPCTFTVEQNKNIPWTERINVALSWFKHDQMPTNLVMTHIEQPDEFGQPFNPDSTMVLATITQLDNLTKYLQQKLVEMKLDTSVNVIIVSDHGMDSVGSANIIDLTQFLTPGMYTFYGSSPVLQVVPSNPAMERALFVNLTVAAKAQGHFKVYNRQTLPTKWNMNNPRRFGPILAVADLKYAFQDFVNDTKIYGQSIAVPGFSGMPGAPGIPTIPGMPKMPNMPPLQTQLTQMNFAGLAFTPFVKYGIDGYDNDIESMRAIFMAKGPLFASGKVLNPFDSVDLCNLFCRILKIKCNRNNGMDRLDIWSVLLK